MKDSTSQNSTNQRNRKLAVFLPTSLIFVWLLFAFGPSSDTIRDNVPRVSVKYPNRPPPSPFNETKVALLIENRPLGHLAPLLLHMISVVPPDWRFLFLGTQETINHVNSSLPVQHHEKNGKLDLKLIPANISITGREEVSQLLTDKWFYNNMIGAAEWLLVFQTDSIMCANSEMSLNTWLEYDWVGAPWNKDDKYGGNGGLSLRRVSALRKVLEFQQREPNGLSEDAWFVSRLGAIPGNKMANGTQEAEFSVERIWHPSPMGYHLGRGNKLPEDVWSDAAQRQKIFEYCPEIKMILDMKLERERCTQEDYDKQKAEKEKQATEGGDKKEPEPAAAKMMSKRDVIIPIAMW